MGKAILVWFILLIVAVGNGAIREKLMRNFFGEGASHVLSTLLLCAFVVAVASLSIGWVTRGDHPSLLLIGTVWVVLTVAFEFLAGHYLFGTSWKSLLADYNLMNGRIWPLFLLTEWIAPIVGARIRGI